MEIIGNIPIPSKHDKYIILDGFLVKNKKPKPVVIFSHGFKGFKDWGHFNFIAQQFAEKEFIFLKFNFSHNGTSFKKPTEFVDLESFGNNNFTKELDDLNSVMDWLGQCEYIEKDEIDFDKIYLMGHSRGGSISILKANEDKRIKKLVTWAAVSDFSKLWNNGIMGQWKKDGVLMIDNKRTLQKMPLNYQIVEDFQKNRERLNIEKAVKNLKIPFLIIHGTNDESVSFTQANEIKSWNPSAKLLVINNGSHTFGSIHPPTTTVLNEQTKQVVDSSIDFFLS